MALPSHIAAWLLSSPANFAPRSPPNARGFFCIRQAWLYDYICPVEPLAIDQVETLVAR
jgi:hypothetical protein